jgi:hypothetical protein
MNVLDENIPILVRQVLRNWGISARQIGRDVAYRGLADAAIIPLLHDLSRPTFFTRDEGFYERRLCHAAYCLVYLAVPDEEAASFVRRFLRHPSFTTHAQRRGTVVRVSHSSIRLWRLRHAIEDTVRWPPEAN